MTPRVAPASTTVPKEAGDSARLHTVAPDIGPVVLNAVPDTVEVGFWEAWSEPHQQKFRFRYATFIFDEEGRLLQRFGWAAPDPVPRRVQTYRHRPDGGLDGIYRLYQVDADGRLTSVDLGPESGVEFSMEYATKDFVVVGSDVFRQPTFLVFDPQLHELTRISAPKPPPRSRGATSRVVQGAQGPELSVGDGAHAWRYALPSGTLLEERTEDDDWHSEGGPFLRFDGGRLLSYSTDGTLAAQWVTKLRGRRGPGSPTNFVLFADSAAYRFRAGAKPSLIFSAPEPSFVYASPSWSGEAAGFCPVVWVNQDSRALYPSAVGAADICGKASPVRIDIDPAREVERVPDDYWPLRNYPGWLTPTSFAVATAADTLSIIKVKDAAFEVQTLREDDTLLGLLTEEKLSQVRWAHGGYRQFSPDTEEWKPLFSEVKSCSITQVAFLDDGRRLAVGYSARNWSARGTRYGLHDHPYVAVVDLERDSMHLQRASRNRRTDRSDRWDGTGDFQPSADHSGLEVVEKDEVVGLWRPWAESSIVPTIPERGRGASRDSDVFVRDGWTFEVEGTHSGHVQLWDAQHNNYQARSAFSKLPISSVAVSSDGQCVGVASEGSEVAIYPNMLLTAPTRSVLPEALPEDVELAIDPRCKLLAIAFGDAFYLVDIASQEWLRVHLLVQNDAAELFVRHSHGWMDMGDLGHQALQAAGRGTQVDVRPVAFPGLLQAFVRDARRSPSK